METLFNDRAPGLNRTSPSSVARHRVSYLSVYTCNCAINLHLHLFIALPRLAVCLISGTASRFADNHQLRDVDRGARLTAPFSLSAY